MFTFIARRDHRVMHVVNSWLAPRWIRLWMIAATRGGDGWLWYAMGLIVLLFGGATRYEALGAASASSSAGVLIFLTLKRLFNRRRPSAMTTHCWATLLPPDQFSFPSGHTITAFAVAVPLGLFYPSLMVGLVFCAVSIALSRSRHGLARTDLIDMTFRCLLSVNCVLMSYHISCVTFELLQPESGSMFSALSQESMRITVDHEPLRTKLLDITTDGRVQLTGACTYTHEVTRDSGTQSCVRTYNTRILFILAAQASVRITVDHEPLRTKLLDITTDGRVQLTRA